MVADAKASRGDIIVVEKFFLSLVRRGVSSVAAASIASAADDVRGLFGEIFTDFAGLSGNCRQLPEVAIFRTILIHFVEIPQNNSQQFAKFPERN